MASMRSGLLSVSDVAHILRRDRKTIARWARSGFLPYADRSPAGGWYRFNPEDVEALRLRLEATEETAS